MDNQASNGQHRPLNGAESGGGGGNQRRTTLVKHKQNFQEFKEKILPTFRITLLLSLVLYLAMLVVGCLAVHKCPVEENIPLFLIVTGAVGLLSKILTVIKQRMSPHVNLHTMEQALYTIETIFFILGAYWVYKEYPPSYIPEDGNRYCQKTGYMFAFVFVTFFLAIAVAIFSGFICFLCCVCLLTVTADEADVEANVEVGNQDNNQGNP